ncbi:hypothetical protein HANVADRAFT_47402 [Hanseniaspora valbyensis NRRL Y-1626]|uniref:Uncharacterized protein n=1 Tax=Hanseniaspora valbyensis NRRL Y-1626 TaxID=766949 RepID=A0A1B7THQ6_9ASCO|nr:hypothetical protein HANVADRAFT_47402 [Hanseniaspora valbyensis NRRL Y-1626]
MSAPLDPSTFPSKEQISKATADLSDFPLPLQDKKLSHPLLVPEIPALISRFQQWTGMPYYQLIPLTTISLKLLVSLPISIWNRKLLIKQNGLRSLTKAMSPVYKMKLTAHNNISNHKLTPDQIRLLSLKQQRKQQKLVFQKSGAQLSKNLLQPMTQLPIWVALTYGIRELPAYLAQNPLDSQSSTNAATANTSNSNILDDSLGDIFPLLDVFGMNLTPVLTSTVLGCVSLLNVEHYSKVLSKRQWYDLGKEHNGILLRNGLIQVSRMFCLGLVFTSFQQTDLLVSYWIVSQLGQWVVNKIVDLWKFESKRV